jgi:hypothetical protein
MPRLPLPPLLLAAAGACAFLLPSVLPAVGQEGPGPSASGPLVEFRSAVEEGAEFVRSHRTVHTYRSPRRSGGGERTASYRIQVAELGADGSGILRYTLEAQHEERTDAMDPADALRAMSHLPDQAMGMDELPAQPSELRLSFDASGAVDLSSEVPSGPIDEEAFIAALWLADFVGPVVRADGLPLGFPPALRVGQSFRAGGQGGSGGTETFTLEAMEERDGRRVARIGISGRFATRESVGEASGHVLFDVEKGRLVEWVMTRRTTVTDAGDGSMTFESEDRIVPATP